MSRTAGVSGISSDKSLQFDLNAGQCALALVLPGAGVLVLFLASRIDHAPGEAMAELREVHVFELPCVGASAGRSIVAIDDFRGRTVAGRHDVVEFGVVEVKAAGLHFAYLEFDWLAQFD